MTTTQSILFPASTQGTHYYQTTPTNLQQANIGQAWAAVDKLSGPQLVELHNLVASNLGRTSTSRFKSVANGQRRTWDLLVAYREQVAAEEAPITSTPAPTSDFVEASSDELAAQKPRQTVSGAMAGLAAILSGKAQTPGEAARIGADIERSQGRNRVADSLDRAAAQLDEQDRGQIKEEAATRKAKREPQAGAIRKPRAPRPDDGAIRMPTEGGKQRAKRQKDGSYAFRIPAGRPRTQTISPEREELLGHLVEGATWASIVTTLNKQDDENHFKAVTTVTMFCITLGYGLETQPDGSIKLIEPLA